MFIRVETRAAFIDALRNVADTQIVDGFNAKDLEDERIEVGGADDDGSGPEVLAADTLPHDDRFVIDCLVYAGKSGQEIGDAQIRTQELMRFCRAALRDPTFDSLTVTTSDGEGFLFDAITGSASGPFTEPGEHAHIGYGSVTVNVHTRFTFS